VHVLFVYWCWFSDWRSRLLGHYVNKQELYRIIKAEGRKLKISFEKPEDRNKVNLNSRNTIEPSALVEEMWALDIALF